MKRRFPSLFWPIFFILTAGCVSYPKDRFVSAHTLGELPVSARGWSPSGLAEAHRYASEIGTTSYVLIVHGKVVDSFGDITQPYRMHSVRKSLLNALYGVAAAKGQIDLNEPIGHIGIDDYVPLSDVEKSARVEDVLASRTGVYRQATYENAGFDKGRPARGSHAPGTYWTYSNWDFNVAGTIYQVKTGRNICSAFEKEIAVKIGMQDFDTSRCSWRYSTRSRHPAYLFEMSTRDLGRFGLLYLQKGKWGRKQILSPSWVERSTRPRSDVVRPDGSPLPGVSYGLLWWTAFNPTAHFPGGILDLGEGAFSAQGTGTQLLMVAPAHDLVFVHITDTRQPKSVDQGSIGKLLQKVLAARPAKAR